MQALMRYQISQMPEKEFGNTSAQEIKNIRTIPATEQAALEDFHSILAPILGLIDRALTESEAVPHKDLATLRANTLENMIEPKELESLFTKITDFAEEMNN